MDKFEFSFDSKDDLQIPRDDPQFMARFENNLALEKRLLTKRPFWRWSLLWEQSTYLLLVPLLAIFGDQFANGRISQWLSRVAERDLSGLVSGAGLFAILAASAAVALTFFPQYLEDLRNP